MRQATWPIFFICRCRLNISESMFPIVPLYWRLFLFNVFWRILGGSEFRVEFSEVLASFRQKQAGAAHEQSWTGSFQSCCDDWLTQTFFRCVSETVSQNLLRIQRNLREYEKLAHLPSNYPFLIPIWYMYFKLTYTTWFPNLAVPIACLARRSRSSCVEE